MKKSLIKLFSLCAFTFAALTFQSCDPDACADVACVNGGVCFEGTCLCEDGFSGTTCETEQRTIFYGTYDNAEECTSAPGFIDDYIMPVTAKSGDVKSEFYIENIYNLENNQNPVAKEDAAIIATVTGDTTFEIADQALSGNAATIRIEGLDPGTISASGVITFNYVLVETSSSPNFRDTCTAVLSPR